METSDKHGPRVADDLTKDTRAGHEELREMQPDALRIDLTQDNDGVMDANEAEARSELARYLLPSVFPARPAQLIEAANENFATDEVLAVLHAIPDRVYDNVQQVWETAGGDVETKRA